MIERTEATVLPDPLQTHRVRRCLFSPELLVHLQRGRFEVVENPIPETARLVGGGFDIEAGCFVLYIADGSFAEVLWGEVTPIHPSPVIRALP